MLAQVKISRGFIFLFAVVAVHTALISHSVAEGSFGQKSRWGLDVARLQNGTSGEYGTMIGFRHLAYFPQGQNSVYAGYEIHTGSAKSGSLGEDNLTYGGLSLGFDGAYFRAITYDFGMVIGYGFGNVARYQISGSSLTFQPQVSFGLMMLAGYRASFSVGYLFMPGAKDFSTWVFGIRLDRKLMSSSTTAAD